MDLSMQLKQDEELKKLNTFGVAAKAQHFTEIRSTEDLQAVRQWLEENPDSDYMVIGGGSNVLFRSDFDGLLLQMRIMGIERLEQDEENFYVRAGAGEVWHSFVRKMLDANMPGLENLAYIPGTVGAAPIQNIGAYGLEAAERIHSVSCFNLTTGEEKELTAEECDFGYRCSIFKKPENKNLVITAVTFKIPKKWVPNTSYKALAEEIEINAYPDLSPQDIYSCVVSLRRRKLPSPVKFGNAGSFFKNPIVDRETFIDLLRTNPSLVSYPLAGGRYKLSAAWLIDNAGLRGYRMGDVGVWEKQPLVIVNFGHATGEDIYALSQDISLRVKNCFGVRLVPEVVLV